MSVLLVLGGARSGKSRHAQMWAEAIPGRLAFVATGQAFDAEMEARIARHKADRGERWHTLEAPVALGEAVAEAGRGAEVVLVDCLTLWLTNLILGDEDITAHTEALSAALAQSLVPVALVANEVGLGIVPENALSRRFRDEAGRLNQRMAALADEVVFVAAGLPLRLKGPN